MQNKSDFDCLSLAALWSIFAWSCSYFCFIHRTRYGLFLVNSCFSSALNMSKTSSELNLLLLFFKTIPMQFGFHAAHFDYSLNSLYQCYATSLNTFYHRPVSYGIISTV